MTRLLRFDFPAEVKHVLEVREAARALCTDLGFSPRETDLLVTAVWEAVLNAATHGSPHGARDRVTVDVSISAGFLTIDITSRDASFRLPDPRPVFDPASLRGRGLPICYAFADEVDLTPYDDRITLHLRKKLPAKPRTADAVPMAG